MGRSFDRGGQSRKERERGKRRSYRQAEQNREALEAVRQAKRKEGTADIVRMTTARKVAGPVAASYHPNVQPMQTAVQPTRPVAIIEPKRPGLLAKVFGLFKKSA
jgi:hypothetical protein